MDNKIMNIDDWRSRLADSIEKSGRSMRSVSLAAGKGPGYLHSLLNEKKEPRIDHLAAICRELKVSLIYILCGAEISATEQEFITLFSHSHPDDRQAVLTLLRPRKR